MMPGPVFAETPFNYAWKGADLFNYGHWLKDAIVRGPASGGERADVGDFYRLAPGRYEQILTNAMCSWPRARLRLRSRAALGMHATQWLLVR